MANFVTTAQWLLPFQIKHIMKQTHLLLNWCWGEAIYLLLPSVWLSPVSLESGWSRSCSCPPACSLVMGDTEVQSALRIEEFSTFLSHI